MGSTATAVFRTATSPIAWGFAFVISSMEMPAAFQSPGTPGIEGSMAALADGVASELSAAAVYALVLLMAPRIGSLARRGWLFAVVPLVGVLGMLLGIALGRSMAHPVVALAGMVSVQVSFTLMLLLGLELLVQLPSGEVRRVVVVSAVGNALIMAVAECAPGVFSLGCLILGAIAFWLGRHALESVPHRFERRALRFPVALALGFAVVVACFGFLQELLYQQDAAMVSTVVAGTKLTAVAVFLGALWIVGDTNYAVLARLVATSAVAAFLIFLAQGSYSFLPSAVMNTGYSLLEMTALLMVAELAASARVQPLRLFSAFFLAESLGYVGGWLVEAVSAAGGGSGLRGAAVVLALALLICAIWVFTEKQVNEFLWGEPIAPASSVETGESASSPKEGDGENTRKGWKSPYGDTVGTVAERFRLSPRETEVLELFAAGRSAAFIAELQFVTTNTVRSHIKHIYAKCDVHSRQELITLIEHTSEL